MLPPVVKRSSGAVDEALRVKDSVFSRSVSSFGSKLKHRTSPTVALAPNERSMSIGVKSKRAVRVKIQKKQNYVGVLGSPCSGLELEFEYSIIGSKFTVRFPSVPVRPGMRFSPKPEDSQRSRETQNCQ